MGAPNTTTKPGRWWRRFTILAGLLLASTAAMPAMSCDGTVFTPSSELLTIPQRVSDATNSGAASHEVIAIVPGMLAVWLAPYLYGLLVAIATWRQPDARHGRTGWDAVIAGYALGVGAAVMYCGAVDIRLYDDLRLTIWGGGCILTQYVPLLGAGYLLRAWWRAGAFRVCATLLGGALTAGWGCLWVCLPTSETMEYGIYVSVAAAGVLMVGAVGEAHAVSGCTWRRTLLALLTASVKPRPSNECQRCGYLLMGLPEPRCPECGTAFAPSLLAAAPSAELIDWRVD